MNAKCTIMRHATPQSGACELRLAIGLAMPFTPTSVSNVSLKIRQAPLHEHARNRLREMIVRGILPPGTNIDEAELCASLGISRTPLREALKLLARAESDHSGS